MDARSARGSTSLIAAVTGGNLGVVNRLLEAGANPEIEEQSGLSAFDIATNMSLRVGIARVLLRALDVRRREACHATIAEHERRVDVLLKRREGSVTEVGREAVDAEIRGLAVRTWCRLVAEAARDRRRRMGLAPMSHGRAPLPDLVRDPDWMRTAVQQSIDGDHEVKEWLARNSSTIASELMRLVAEGGDGLAAGGQASPHLQDALDEVARRFYMEQWAPGLIIEQ